MGSTQDQVVWEDAVAQAEAIRRREVSATELVDRYLARIEQHDGVLRSFVAVDADGARQAARAADGRTTRVDPRELPPFHGVTLSVKDVVDVAGLPTTHSCKVLADAVAATDDPCVSRFREAGFVILGKTNVPEFCTTMTSSELNGVCRNPWDTDRTSGGSSGGAAAALSAGLCAISHGTDGAGSVRSPAAFCGLVGVKPTRGLVTHGPETDRPYYGTSVDGVLTRSVRDAATALDAMIGSRDRRTAWSPRTAEPLAAELDRPPAPLRIAVTTEAPFGTTTPECADAAEEVGRVLEGMGHAVEQSTPAWATILAAAAGPMAVPGAAALVGMEDIDRVEPRNRPLIRSLAALTVLDHARWVEQVRAAAAEFLVFWDTFDVLVSPTAGVVAPPVTWAPWDQDPESHMTTFMQFPNFAQPFNLSGQPGLSLPLATSGEGLPIGVHLAGRRLDEGLLLRVARQLELALPWSDRRPPGFA